MTQPTTRTPPGVPGGALAPEFALLDPGIAPGVLWWAYITASTQQEPTWLAYALACDPHCPGYLLEQLAAHEDAHIRATAARHPGLSPSDLERLAHDPEDIVRSGIATRRDLPHDLAVLLAEDPSKDVILSLLMNNAATDADLCRRLAQRHGPSNLLAQNVNTPADVLTAINNATADLAVLANPNASDTLLRAMARIGPNDVGVITRISENPGAPLDLLETILDQHPEMAAPMASNPNCTPALFERLAGSGNTVVHGVLVQNNQVPASLVTTLIDRNRGLEGLVAGRNDCQALFADRLAQSEIGRSGLVLQPWCPYEVLCYTLEHDSEQSQLRVLSHPKADWAILAHQPVSQLLRVRIATNQLPELEVAHAAVVISLARGNWGGTLLELFEAADLLGAA